MTNSSSDGIFLNERGVFRKKANGKPHRIADPIEYAAEIITESSSNMFVLLAFETGDKRRVEVQTQPADFRSWPKFRDLVLNNGYDLPHDPTEGKLIHRHLIENGPAERLLIVNRIGWRNKDFVLTGEKYNDGNRISVFQPLPNGRVGNFEQSGTLEGWQEGVAELAIASSRLMLAIAMAFATPLLRFTNFDNCGIHLFGPSSKGKTTCLLAAMSVNGRAERRLVQTWNITEAGLEETAMGHNDTLMCLDELAIISGNAAEKAKWMQKIHFMLASGTGRTRSKAYEAQHSIHNTPWRIMVLSTGEKGLNDLASEGALQRLKGAEVRFIDFPAIVDEDLGIYEQLPDGFSSPAELSEKIEAACGEHHGVALRQFVTEVGAHTDTLAESVATLVDKFMSRMNLPPDGWERRFARPFALCYAAARLASDWKILPWSGKEIGSAIKACYVAARGQVPDVEELREDAIARLRKFLHGNTVLRQQKDSNSEWTTEEIEAAEAFRRKTRERGAHFLIRPEVLERRFNPLTRKLLLKWLKTQDHLIMEEGRALPTVQAHVAGVEGRLRYYAVKASVLREEPQA